MKDNCIPKTPKTDKKLLEDEEEKVDPEKEEQNRKVREVIQEIIEEKKDDTRTHSVVDSSPENQMIDEEDELERPARASITNRIVPKLLDYSTHEQPIKFNETIPALEKYAELINSSFSTTGVGMELPLPA